MKRDRTARLLIITGVLLLLCAGAWAAYNHMLGKQAGQTAQKSLETLMTQMPEPVVQEPAEMPVTKLEPTVPEPVEQVVIPDYILDPGMDMPEQDVEGVAYIGYLELPALNLTLPVCSETNDWHLKLAPCRFSGSAYQDDLVIGGHNYTTHFGGLGSMEYGDTVRFTDVDGNVFAYEVTDFETLQPNQGEDLRTGDWDLTLYTCTFNSESRLVLRCAKLDQ